MIILASKSVIEGNRIETLFYVENCWFVLSEKDSKNKDDIEIENFEIYDESSLYERLPILKGKLTSDDETMINVDLRDGSLNFNPKHKHIGFSTNDQARATNQANFQMSYLAYITNRPIYSIKIAFISFILVLLSVKISWFFILYLLRFLFLHVFSMLSKRNMYLSGTLNPALVVTENPTRIAVLVNLSKYGGKYPLIRVREVELPVRDMKVGTRIAVAGSYQTSDDRLSYWNFFNPLPLQWATRDANKIEEKLAEISTYDWIKLSKEVKAKDYNKGGYFPIDIETSDWKHTEEPGFVFVNEES